MTGIDGLSSNEPRTGIEDAELWDSHADWWQREFTDGVDPEYTEQILPIVEAGLAGTARVLDIGTGEGQVARRLQEAGCSVVGIDPIRAQLDTATRRGGGPHYLRATAAGLPFADASFEGAVACLVFEHIDPLDSALGELARILVPGGRLLFLLNHPLLQTPGSGWIDDQIIDPPEQYWRIGPYLTEASTVEEVHKDVFVRFVHRPLSRYVNSLAAVGLTVTKMDEPAPPPGFLARAEQYRDAATIPRLLVLHLTKST
ncbi:MAG: methyltransferase domain-containing protein [Acidimicrobiia bacterium]|nr:methyltransferase domain-containing protein [Acidimicrobiia bacterium]